MRRRRLPALVALLAGLAATVLAAAPAAAGGGGCHRPATEGRGTTLALAELCFSPTVLRVEPGSEVTIVNRDTLEHPLARPGGQWGWGGAVGDQTTVRFERSGVYPFFCYAHPGMVGVVVVGDARGSDATAAGMVDVAAQAEAAPADPAPARPAPGSFPTAWLVLVALAALVGAAACTRLATRSRAA